MTDEHKTKRQLIDELHELRQRVAALEEEVAGRGERLIHPAAEDRPTAAVAEAKRDRDRLEAILTTAIDCLPFEFFAIGTDGRYIYLNAVLRERFGDGIGQRPEELAPDEASRRLWLENNRRAAAGERVEGEFERPMGGETRHFYNVVMPIQQGDNFYGILGVNVDVTRRKRAEAALQKAHDELECRVAQRTAELTAANRQLQREVEDRRRAEESLRQSEEKHRSLLEACPDAVVMTDLERRVVFASRQTWRLLGVPEGEELVGRDVLDNVIDSDRPRLAANYANVLVAGTRRNTEYTVRRRDGTLVPTETCSAVICDAAGTPRGAMAVIRDISERRKTEAALRKEHRMLERMLRASDHERQLIAYDIHDGLAQQLAGAIMQFQVYDHLKEADPAEAQQAYLGGTTLLRQAHLEARRLISGVRPPVLDESGIVAAVSHLIEDRGHAGGVKVEFHSKVRFGRLAPVLENVIYRIIQEGLGNALRHSRSQEVRVSLLQRGGKVRIEIRDWGVGFNPDAAREDRFGLAGIRQRAHLLGGKCRIESQPGQGTTVLVELPVLERNAAG